MIKKIIINSLLTCAAALVVAYPQRSHSDVFDDFNVNEGRFTGNINASGTTVGEDGVNSTADRVTTNNPVEGNGHQKLVLVHDATTTPFRLRHLSGGGSPGNNVAIPTTAGVDGKIGFYLKTTSTGWETSIALDGQANSIAQMAGSTFLPVIADGEWHLYEWDLDSTTDWGAVSGIGGGFGGALPDRATNTIDSIYLRDSDGSPGPTAEIYLDFVGWNPNGTVADLLAVPCISTPSVLVIGPIATNLPVTVSAVDASATNITIYQDSGAGMVNIGSLTTGIVAGDNSVPVSGLIVGAKVIATQFINGQESCLKPNSGIFVGGGANPAIRVAYTVRETTNLGPVGQTATANGSGNLFFIGASTVSGGAPVDATSISPSTNWQTVSIGGRVRVANTANVVGTLTNGSLYAANDSVVIKVFPFKTVNGNNIYSVTNGVAVSAPLTSPTEFGANWTWDAVPGANGYRVVRDRNAIGFFEYVEVSTNSLVDTDNGVWIFAENTTPTPTSSQLSPTIQWNPTVGNTNGPATEWGVLESLNFAIDSDTGPFNIFIDTLENDSIVFQSFETVDSGTQDYGFRAPSFSGTTGPNLLSTPNLGMVTNLVADTGTNSLNVQFQWSGTNVSRWLRLTTSAAGAAANPLINLDAPLSFRILLVPVGTVIEPPAQPPTIGYSLSGDQLTLTWTGTFNLQSKTSLSDATWTNVGVDTSPYVTTVTGDAKFFRLQAP